MKLNKRLINKINIILKRIALLTTSYSPFALLKGKKRWRPEGIPKVAKV